MKLLPPTGFTMECHRVNIRAGGDAFYSMTNGQFTIANEKLSRHPVAPTGPTTHVGLARRRFAS